MTLTDSLKFSLNRPLDCFGLVVAMSVRMYVSGGPGILSPSHAIFFKASHWPSDHMIRFRPLIGLSNLCPIDENSQEVHNVQSPDEKMWKMCSSRPSELCLLDENFSITCNLLVRDSVSPVCGIFHAFSYFDGSANFLIPRWNGKVRDLEEEVSLTSRFKYYMIHV